MADAYAAPRSGPTPLRPDVGPDIDAELETLFPTEDPFAPKYPAWFYTTETVTDPFGGETTRRVLKPPPEPSAGRFEEWIQNDILLYGELLRRFRTDLRIYRQQIVSVGRDFDPDSDATFTDSEATVQINKIAAMVAGTPHQVTYPWRTKKERQDAAKMESFALWWIEQWQAQHRIGNADLKWDMAWYFLVYGRACVEVHCDLDDGDFPWWVDLLDPATCFPIWGASKRGMERMSRQYTASAGAFLDRYDPTGERGLAKTHGFKAKRGDSNSIDYTADVKMTECHTRWHKYVGCNGTKVEITAHEYGKVPFVYVLAPGEAGGASAPGTSIDTGLTAADIRRGEFAETSTSPQRDIANKGQSFFHPIRYALAQREKVLALHMLSLEQTVNPATITTTAYPTPPAPLDLGPGGSNTRRQGEQTTPAVPSPRPMESQTILAVLNATIAKGLLPDVIFGQTEGSNITGFASDSLMAAAKDRIQPYYTAEETLLADCVQLATELFYNFSHAAEGLSDGQLIIPRQNRGGHFVGGLKPAPPPAWASGIVQKMMEQMQAPGGPLGPPPPPPTATPLGGGGMIGSDVPGAPPGAGSSPPGMSGGNAMMAPSMGGIGPMGPPPSRVGTPGYVDPRWTMEGPPPEDEALVVISRETIDNVAARPVVTLNSLGLNGRTTLINYLLQAVNGKLMRRSTAMDQLPEVQDTLEEWNGIIAEDAITNPDMLRNIYYPRSLAEQGDVDAFMQYWATILLPQMMQALAPMLPGMAGGGGSPPAPGGPSGAAPIDQEPPATGAVNPAMIGRGPGSQGGPVGRPG